MIIFYHIKFRFQIVIGTAALMPVSTIAAGLFGKKGGGSQNKTIVERHFVQEPALLKEVDAFRTQIQNIKTVVEKLKADLSKSQAEAKKAHSPELYKQLRAQSFEYFLNGIQNLAFQEKNPKVNGQRHHVSVGNIISGKSSLINYSCGTKTAYWSGRNNALDNQSCEIIGPTYLYLDSPGINEDFQFYDISVLAYFHSADRVFILYPDSLKSCKDLVRVLQKIKPNNTFLVRTKCDTFEYGHDKTIQEQISRDKQLLNEWHIKLPVLATSTRKGQNFMDNALFKDLLVGHHQFLFLYTHIIYKSKLCYN